MPGDALKEADFRERALQKMKARCFGVRPCDDSNELALIDLSEFKISSQSADTLGSTFLEKVRLIQAPEATFGHERRRCLRSQKTNSFVGLDWCVRNTVV
jgi:hypothetical protein